jgi:hypothetical protein
MRRQANQQLPHHWYRSQALALLKAETILSSRLLHLRTTHLITRPILAQHPFIRPLQVLLLPMLVARACILPPPLLPTPGDHSHDQPFLEHLWQSLVPLALNRLSSQHQCRLDTQQHQACPAPMFRLAPQLWPQWGGQPQLQQIGLTLSLTHERPQSPRRTA